MALSNNIPFSDTAAVAVSSGRIDMNFEAINNTPSLFIALALMVVVFMCIGFLFFQLNQLHRNQENSEIAYDKLQSTLDNFHDDLQKGYEFQRMIEVELKTLRARQRQIDLREPQAIPYTHAITMVKRGAQATDLISSCGLSQGEADLIIAIHGNNQ